MRQQNVEYYDNDINWYFNGKLHRDADLPARYYFDFRDGKLIGVSYCQHGKDHRAIGPAYIDYELKRKWYYYQDKKYDSLKEIKMLEACR